MRFIIYKITNLINGKIYIGKHKCKHLDDGYFGSGCALETAIRKYGKENFVFHLEFELQNQQEMDLLERSVVTKEFVGLRSNYNMSVGGPNCILYGESNGFFGRHHSEETKRKIRDARKNFHQSEENKKRISNTLRKRYREHPELRGAYTQNRGKVICIDKDGNRKYFYPDKVPEGYRIRILAHDIPHRVPEEIKSQNRKKQGMRSHNSRWFNNGKDEIFCYPENCPEGYVRGRLPGLNVGRKYSEKTLLKMSLRARGKKAFNEGKISITDGRTVKFIDKNSSIPNGWRRGMQKRKAK